MFEPTMAFLLLWRMEAEVSAARKHYIETLEDAVASLEEQNELLRSLCEFKGVKLPEVFDVEGE